MKIYDQIISSGRLKTARNRISYFLAIKAGANPEEMPWVEEFKRLVKK